MLPLFRVMNTARTQVGILVCDTIVSLLASFEDANWVLSYLIALFLFLFELFVSPPSCHLLLSAAGVKSQNPIDLGSPRPAKVTLLRIVDYCLSLPSVSLYCIFTTLLICLDLALFIAL